MLCPVCSDSRLARSVRENVQVDHCPRCRGVWLDRGELERIIGRAAAVAAGVTIAGRHRPDDHREPGRMQRRAVQPPAADR